MPVVRVIQDVQCMTLQDAEWYVRQRGGDAGVLSAEIVPAGLPHTIDPITVSGLLRTAADYAVMLADAVDKLPRVESVKSDVTSSARGSGCRCGTLHNAGCICRPTAQSVNPDVTP